MDIEFGNSITVDELNGLRKLAGWKTIEKELAQKTIENALFLITAVYNKEVIGVARVCGDGGYTIIITDVIVKPEYQGKGIGKKFLQEIMKFIKTNLKDGQEAFVNLMAAKGKESFYKQFGFTERPNDDLGAGMTQWVGK
jgi:predicted GNAT family N-acyltransferase